MSHELSEYGTMNIQIDHIGKEQLVDKAQC